MMIRIDKFQGGLNEFREFAKRQYVLEITGRQAKGRVKVGTNLFESAEAFNQWAQDLELADFDKLCGQFVEFPDAGAVSLT